MFVYKNVSIKIWLLKLLGIQVFYAQQLFSPIVIHHMDDLWFLVFHDHGLTKTNVKQYLGVSPSYLDMLFDVPN